MDMRMRMDPFVLTCPKWSLYEVVAVVTSCDVLQSESSPRKSSPFLVLSIISTPRHLGDLLARENNQHIHNQPESPGRGDLRTHERPDRLITVCSQLAPVGTPSRSISLSPSPLPMPITMLIPIRSLPALSCKNLRA